jgi:hypothetical protein
MRSVADNCSASARRRPPPSGLRGRDERTGRVQHQQRESAHHNVTRVPTSVIGLDMRATLHRRLAEGMNLLRLPFTAGSLLIASAAFAVHRESTQGRRNPSTGRRVRNNHLPLNPRPTRYNDRSTSIWKSTVHTCVTRCGSPSCCSICSQTARASCCEPKRPSRIGESARDSLAQTKPLSRC